jgi:hypothetical protein
LSSAAVKAKVNSYLTRERGEMGGTGNRVFKNPFEYIFVISKGVLKNRELKSFMA